MSVPPRLDLSTFSLPARCEPQNAFLHGISSAFSVCLPTPLAFFSSICGYLSILSWLCAQLPQVFKNYQLQSANGLSVYFLLVWFLGDGANLAGAILTRQAAWQVLLACYYTFIDLALVFQYWYYTHYRPKHAAAVVIAKTDASGPEPEQTGGSGSDSSTVFSGAGSIASNEEGTDTRELDGAQSCSKPRDVPFGLFQSNSSSPREKGTPVFSRPLVNRVDAPALSPATSTRTLLVVSLVCVALSRASPVPGGATESFGSVPPASLSSSSSSSSSSSYASSGISLERELIGNLVSWFSTLMYLGSRLPQLYKNHVRRSTSGLALTLFVAAFFGNLFYSTSLLANPLAWGSYPPYGLHGWLGNEGSDRTEWVASAAPFFLGAAGVLALDAAVGVQFLMFGQGGDGEQVVRVRDSRGFGRWHRVRGWMRGWIPRGIPARRALSTKSTGADSADEPLLRRSSSRTAQGDYGST